MRIIAGVLAGLVAGVGIGWLLFSPADLGARRAHSVGVAAARADAVRGPGEARAEKTAEIAGPARRDRSAPAAEPGGARVSDGALKKRPLFSFPAKIRRCCTVYVRYA